MEADSTRGANERVVLEYVEAFNRGDTDGLQRLLADDAQVYGALGRGGLEEIVPVWRTLHAAFAFRLRVEELLAQGDVVVARLTERGTSVGPFRGQAATGAASEVVAIE